MFVRAVPGLARSQAPPGNAPLLRLRLSTVLRSWRFRLKASGSDAKVPAPHQTHGRIHIDFPILLIASLVEAGIMSELLIAIDKLKSKVLAEACDALFHCPD